jgi:transcriptional accessory protein Tex/SPT6
LQGGVFRISAALLQNINHVTFAGHQQAAAGPSVPTQAVELNVGDTVHGFVRSAAPPGSKGAGVFVSLSPQQHGRVQLRALAAHFVDDPATAFPEGKHVQARVTDLKGDRIEMSLKATQSGQSGWLTMEDLEEGKVRALLCAVLPCPTIQNSTRSL